VANNAKITSAFVDVALTDEDRARIAGAFLDVGLGGPFSTVSPIARITGAFADVGLEYGDSEGAARVVGAFVDVGLVAPFLPPLDPNDFAERLPNAAARGLGLTYWACLFSNLQKLLEEVASLNRAIIDPYEAEGYQLDFMGDAMAVYRDGLTDDEYRAIILAREAAQESAHALPDIWRAWSGMVGAHIDNRYYLQGAGTLYLVAFDNLSLDAAYLARVKIVLDDLMPAGFEISGAIAAPGPDPLIWGSDWGGDWGYSV
jgi:hypothetical protein